MSHRLTFSLASLILICGLIFAVAPVQAADMSLSVVFNEVANRSTAYAQYEWIELLIKDDNPNFENWKVSAVTDLGTETTIFKLPKLDPQRYGDILLITASDPTGFADHPLAGGFNVAMSADEQPRGIDHTIRYYVADWMNELPNGEFVLMLRSDEGVVDLAGYHSSLALPNYPAPDKSNNALAVGTVRYRQHTDIIGTGTKGGNNQDKVAFREQFWTGVGYKRNAQAIDANGGTPGYPNDAVRPSVDAYGNVVISEIMYASGDSNLPQWIELKNMSETVDVDIRHWKLWVTNHSETADGGTYAGELEHEINLEGTILAGQTFLIVANSDMNVARLPSARVLDVGVGDSETLLNPHGFELYLEANTYELDHKYHLRVDVARNIDLSSGRSQTSLVPALWSWPKGYDADGNRVSVVRKPSVDGESADAWQLYNMSGQINRISTLTSYGHSSDVASPGHSPGGALPVTLSKFRPERLKGTGEIVIRWITESETNNAGFNILRSETKNGQYTKVNTRLIAGQGTTSERTVYEFSDKTAKPNIVYYYQIQDVSLEGKVQTLRTSRLKGNVTAAGKVTTTWAGLKTSDK